jgi:hypothetical protein
MNLQVIEKLPLFAFDEVSISNEFVVLSNTIYVGNTAPPVSVHVV